MRYAGPILFLFLLALFFTEDSKASCRSEAVKHKFDVQHGYPHGRKGFVVDHVCALECGGIDAPINMQYQDKAASQQKDRWERSAKGCALTCDASNSTKTRQVFNCK